MKNDCDKKPNSLVIDIKYISVIKIAYVVEKHLLFNYYRVP